MLLHPPLRRKSPEVRGAVEGSDLWTRFLETRAELYRTGETGCFLAEALQKGMLWGFACMQWGSGVLPGCTRGCRRLFIPQTPR